MSGPHISAGTEWEQEIEKHLNKAPIILLLISPDFISSEYCYGTEMKRALELHKRGEARVIPVILRPVGGWEKVPPGDIQLGQLQALPKDAKPITRWTDRDEAWKDVTEGISRVANELLSQSTPISDLGANTPAGMSANPPSLESLPRISRRAAMIGLGTLAAVGVAGGSIVFLTRSQEKNDTHTSYPYHITFSQAPTSLSSRSWPLVYADNGPSDLITVIQQMLLAHNQPSGSNTPYNLGRYGPDNSGVDGLGGR